MVDALLLEITMRHISDRTLQAGFSRKSMATGYAYRTYPLDLCTMEVCWLPMHLTQCFMRPL
jgi:hypothetical protein